MKALIWQSLIRRFFPAQHIKDGRTGENLAAHFLEKEGYFIWKRNWRCKAGELDIIAWRGGILSFIEVKTRKDSDRTGYSPFEAVDRNKQRKLRCLARIFRRQFARQLKERRIRHYRFEVAGVYLSSRQGVRPRIELRQEAFKYDDKF